MIPRSSLRTFWGAIVVSLFFCSSCSAWTFGLEGSSLLDIISSLTKNTSFGITVDGDSQESIPEVETSKYIVNPFDPTQRILDTSHSMDGVQYTISHEERIRKHREALDSGCKSKADQRLVIENKIRAAFNPLRKASLAICQNGVSRVDKKNLKENDLNDWLKSEIEALKTKEFLSLREGQIKQFFKFRYGIAEYLSKNNDLLNKVRVSDGSKRRAWKYPKLMSVGDSLIEECKIDLYKYGGSTVRRRTYERLNAVVKTLQNPSDYQKIYELDKSVPGRLDFARVCIGNTLQHQIHSEIVGLVNRHSDMCRVSSYAVKNSPDIFALSDFALHLKDNKDYEKAFSFIDFCLSVADTSIVRALMVGPRGIASGVSSFSTNIKNMLDLAFDRLLGYREIESLFKNERCQFCNNEDCFGCFGAKLSHGERIRSICKSLTEGVKELGKSWDNFCLEVNRFVADPEQVSIDGISHMTQSALHLSMMHIGLSRLELVAQSGSLTFDHIAEKVVEKIGVSKVERPAVFVEGEPVKSEQVISEMAAEKSEIDIIKNVVSDGAVTRQEILQELHRAIKELRPTDMEMVDRQLEAFLRGPFKKNTLLRVRKDFGQHAHPLETHGYLEPVDHYNIEILEPKCSEAAYGKLLENNMKIHRKVFCKGHIIIDGNGDITDFWFN